jgi:hypothetical protein
LREGFWFNQINTHRSFNAFKQHFFHACFANQFTPAYHARLFALVFVFGYWRIFDNTWQFFSFRCAIYFGFYANNASSVLARWFALALLVLR